MLSDVMCDVVHGYLDSMANVKSTGTVPPVEMQGRVFAIVAAALGFRYFSYHLYCPKEAPHKLVRDPNVLTNLPNGELLSEQWCAYFLDPGVRRFLGSERHPFLWSRVVKEGLLGRDDFKWFNEARSLNVDDAVVTAFLGVGGELGVITMFFESGESTNHIVDSELTWLFLIVNHFQQHSRSALLERESVEGSRRRNTLLSSRETVVLEWVAKGKSTQEIATILELSGKGVEFHIEGCKRKLNVFSRTHAVAKAILIGLLRFEHSGDEIVPFHQQPATQRSTTSTERETHWIRSYIHDDAPSHT